jgi:hypothetical protein
MKLYYTSVITIILLIVFNKDSLAQIETRLATNCATKRVEVPVILKNLENITDIKLRLIFDNDILSFDTSLYHHPDFAINTNDIYQIKATASGDTISIDWSAYYGVNLSDGLLLSLIFTETGSGDASFSWIEEECRFTDINELNIGSDYIVDGELAVPYNTNVQLDFTQFNTGCRDNSENGGCKAQAIVKISGGMAPYAYQWRDRFNQKDSIAQGLCEDPVAVVITDAGGCIYADLFDPVIYPAINPEDVDGFKIEYAPEEIFITKPYVEFTVDPGGTIIEKYEWDFGDETSAFTQTVEHAYQKVEIYTVSLRTENIDGCDTTITANIEVQELNFCIPNVFTPNGDGINDTWIFKLVGSEGGGDNGDSGSEFKDTGLSDVTKCSGEDLIFSDHFKSTALVVYNRNGSKVFECTNCSDNWDGGGLPDGAYFYVFTWEGEYSNGVENGNVTILGSSN